MASQPRILVLGGGLTAAALATLLRGAQARVAVWDKAGRAGGRFTTHRGPGSRQVDLGGQYLTVTGRYRALHRHHYSGLVARGLLSPLQGVQEQEDRGHIGERREVRAMQGGRAVALDHQCYQEDEQDLVTILKTENYVAPRGVEVSVYLFDELVFYSDNLVLYLPAGS